MCHIDLWSISERMFPLWLLDPTIKPVWLFEVSLDIYQSKRRKILVDFGHQEGIIQFEAAIIIIIIIILFIPFI